MVKNNISKFFKKLEKYSNKIFNERKKWFLQNFKPARHMIAVIGLANDSMLWAKVDNKFMLI